MWLSSQSNLWPFPKNSSLWDPREIFSLLEKDWQLETEGRLKNFSPLLQLDPFSDGEGVLCVRGCLANSSLPFETTFPVILPWWSHVTTLIVKYFHEKITHQGRGMTLNEIRANGYWIVGRVPTVGSYIWSCIVCNPHRSLMFHGSLRSILWFSSGSFSAVRYWISWMAVWQWPREFENFRCLVPSSRDGRPFLYFPFVCIGNQKWIPISVS